MPVKKAMKYYKALSIIKAKEAIDSYSTVSYPYMDKKDRKELFKEKKATATQGKIDKKEIMSFDQFAAQGDIWQMKK